ncbi:MAG: serine/threonine protein kinase [Oscillospiraceae bacterium]|nr:serine/threonine protein kinase [Oscillospiraceae bacterium]
MLTRDMIIDKRYKILDEIGRGGMSVVYRATVERSGKIWAVKEVRKDGRNDYNVVKQNLIAEIETLKEVKHPKLPEIADVIDNEDSFIIVMDYIEGVSLDKILEKKGVQSEEKVVDWAKQLCEVLGYLHSKNIIYRDMKPSNVMLKKNGEITIIDFGTAKKYEYNSGETTGLGTAGFAAPEQYGGQGRTDARTDIFCLGMTLYALLTGINPQKQFIPDTSIRKVNSAFSSGLDQIILKCTEKNPEKRYQSCEELLYYLREYKYIDGVSRKKKIAKLSVFTAFFAVSVISGVCGYVFSLQAKALATDNYQELLDDASAITINSQDDDYAEKHAKKISLYEQAIDIPNKAGEKNAYLGLIEAYKENDGESPVFSKEEAEQITNLMSNHKTDFETNKENYVEICYEIGNLYWYYYDDKNQVTKSIYAINWFQEVTKNADKNYDKRKQGLAEAYAAIGIFYRDNVTLVTEARDDKTYDELLRNLQDLMDGIATNKDEADIVRLEVLEMARYALQRYTTDFKRDDVDEERLIALHKRIETVLNSIDVEYYGETHPLYIKKSEIEANMADTESAVRNAYGTTRKETKIS